MTDFLPSTRRRFLASSVAGAGALAGLSTLPSAFAADGRKTDTLRLTWGFTGLTFIAKERG